MKTRPAEVLAAACAAVLLALPATALAADGKALVGRWALELDPSQVMVLKGDGTGSFAGEPIRWQVRDGQLAITDREGVTDTNGYRLQGDQLVMQGQGGLTVGFRRSGAAPAPAPAQGRPGVAGSAPGAAPRSQPQPVTPGPGPGQGSAVDQQVRQLLLANAWCSFGYKATQGGGGYGDRTTSGRVVFQADGTGYRGSRSEGYSTGSGGQFGSQAQGGQRFRWQVQNGRLLVDTGNGLQDVNLGGERNSNGYVILKAGGVEYMMCK
jgi:hypothetical protein